MEEIIYQTPILSVDIKSKSFDSLTLISDLKFDIFQSEIVSILGASGIGKSTLLKIIAGLDVNYVGEVKFEGRKIYSPIQDISLILQGHVLIPWLTVKRNIKFFNDNVDDSKISLFLEKVGIASKGNYKPNKLSGGEKTRVALSIALLGKTQLLLMDEPFADIDLAVKNDIYKFLITLQQEKNTTQIVTTHNIEDAVSIANRVIVIGSRPATIIYNENVSEENKDVVKNTLYEILSKRSASY